MVFVNKSKCTSGNQFCLCVALINKKWLSFEKPPNLWPDRPKYLCIMTFESWGTLFLFFFLTYFSLNLIFFNNFIPKLKFSRVSFKSQKCASLSCAQWDIWLTFKYLSTPLHHAQRKVTFIPKRNPCDYEKTRRRNLKIKQLFMYVLINILIIQTRGCHCLIHK